MRENLLTHLQQLAANKLPFMALRVAGKQKVQVLSQRDNHLYKTPPDTMAYAVFSEFISSKNQVFIHGEVINNFIFKSTPSVVSGTTATLSKKEKERYLNVLQTAITTLQTTELKKVVLSRKQTFNTSKTPEDLYATLLDTYPTANCYYFCHPQVGLWMGATPELLAHIDDDQLTTMSLAGTALWQEGAVHHWGDKELEEQALVTTHIRDALTNDGAVGIVAQPLETVQAGKLIHLRTIIKATVPVNRQAAIIQALHPTPAICGIPTAQALKFIQQHEGYDREFYAGYFGIVRPKENKASYFVNLRCMQLVNNNAVVYVGGGVTALSNAALELQETIHKSQVMSLLL